jgi:hypothetical protein
VLCHNSTYGLAKSSATNPISDESSDPKIRV